MKLRSDCQCRLITVPLILNVRFTSQKLETQLNAKEFSLKLAYLILPMQQKSVNTKKSIAIALITKNALMQKK